MQNWCFDGSASFFARGRHRDNGNERTRMNDIAAPKAAAAILDLSGRRIDYARISVTDRCNYRCVYCMPEDGVPQIAHDHVMRYEEILFLAQALAELGIRKIRFTGGEPLLRKGFVPFLKDFRRAFPDMALSMTTNASLLGRYAKELAAIGMSGINISLDTVDPAKFKRVTRIGDFSDVAAGIAAAQAHGMAGIKTNTVLIRGFNDDELLRILNYAWNRNITPRVIEFMPLGDDLWNREKFLSAAETMHTLAALGEWRREEPAATVGMPYGPAAYYTNTATGKRVGIIEAVSNHFCAACNRLRITAAGNMRACLFSREELPLLPYIRRGDMAALKEAVKDEIRSKPDDWEHVRDGKQQMSGIGG